MKYTYLKFILVFDLFISIIGRRNLGRRLHTMIGDTYISITSYPISIQYKFCQEHLQNEVACHVSEWMITYTATKVI